MVDRFLFHSNITTTSESELRIADVFVENASLSVEEQLYQNRQSLGMAKHTEFRYAKICQAYVCRNIPRSRTPEYAKFTYVKICHVSVCRNMPSLVTSEHTKFRYAKNMLSLGTLNIISFKYAEIRQVSVCRNMPSFCMPKYAKFRYIGTYYV
jgi:hypothetical protein